MLNKFFLKKFTKKYQKLKQKDLMNNEGLYDGMFEQILQQNQGIDGFWAQVFSFLRRRSDFFANQSK